MSSIYVCFFLRRTTRRTQENADHSKEGVQFSLAIKFTSEKPRNVQTEEDPVATVSGDDPSSRPAGLSLRTPVPLGSYSSRSSPKAPEHESRETEKVRDPERSTLAWTPAPLLCRRLNVPVPKVSALIDWATKSGPRAGRGAAAATAPQQDVPGSLGKFVPEVAAPKQPKVRYFMYSFVRNTGYYLPGPKPLAPSTIRRVVSSTFKV